MNTLEDVCRYTIANVASANDLGLPIVFRWVEQRYREISNRTHLRHLRQVGELVTPAPITAGTVTVTQGSTQVVGSGTAFTSALRGWYFRFNTNWYLIDDVQGQTLTLHSPFVESVTAVTGYSIVQRFVPLAQNVQWIGTVAHPRLFRLLVPRTLNWLDSREPSRILVAAFPTVWAEGPAYHGDYAGTPDMRKTIEIYPYSPQQEFFQYVYWEQLPPQTLQSLLPPEIDPYMIYEGVKADVYEYRREKALTMTPPQPEVASMYDRSHTKALSIWEQKLQQLVVKDMIAMDEDVELWSGYETAGESDIDSGYDNYVSRLGIITVQ